VLGVSAVIEQFCVDYLSTKWLFYYGSAQAIDVALQQTPRPRKSMLVQKTHAQMELCA